MSAVEISVRDLKRIRVLLNSTLTLLQAEGIANAARAMTDVRASPLAIETEEIFERVGNILGQYALENMADEPEEEEAPEPEELEPIEHTSTMLTGPDMSKTRDTIIQRQAVLDEAAAEREAIAEAEAAAAEARAAADAVESTGE